MAMICIHGGECTGCMDCLDVIEEHGGDVLLGSAAQQKDMDEEGGTP
jgi:hypothetical protein